MLKFKRSDSPINKNDKTRNFRNNTINKTELAPYRLPEKKFLARSSLLTDTPYSEPVRKIFMVILISQIINVTARDLLKNGRITLGFQHFSEGLTNFHMAFFIWIFMFASTIAVYGSFRLWATVRMEILIKPKHMTLELWDALWIILFIVYCIGLMCFTLKAVIENSLRSALSRAVIMEMLRMLMKVYAFVRNNVPRALKYKMHAEEKVLCPEFSKFLYFSFAPTLIYRDSYPRTTHVRWNYVVLCFAEIVAAVFCMHLIEQYVLVPSFKIEKARELQWQDIVLLTLENGISWMFYWFCVLYTIFHACQNAFAEMLKFADRLFYGDWWNSTSYGRYHRTWNLIVQDWLYMYIYKDMYEIILPGRKVAAKAMVFFVSAAFHEIIYAFAFRVFYPVGFALFFVVGLPVTIVKLKNTFLANVLFLYTLVLGFGILTNSLIFEHYIRINYPLKNATLISYFMPRTFNLNSIK